MISSYISKLVQSQTQFPPAASLFWFRGCGDPSSKVCQIPQNSNYCFIIHSF